jgi:TRAP-type C4-dicarboxylate transport system permease small subunit
VKALNDSIYRGLRIILTVLMMALLVPVSLQIASHLTDRIPHLPWTEEAARFLFIWIIMIGAAVAVRDGSHFDLDVLPPAKTARGRAFSRLVVHVAMLSMALTFVVFGWSFALFGNEQESDLLGLNMLWIHVAWPAAGAVFVLFLIEKLQSDVRLWREGEHEPG